jgi:hypothetical protein
MLKIALLFIAGACALSILGADLPVRQVVLYKHGVGYFERSGQLAAGESARLDFKAAEMNDVLKSLTIEERGGGKVTGLRYDSSEPLTQRLAEFPFKLGDQEALSAILDQLKGARVELKVGSESLTAVIVGGRLIPGDDKRPQQEQLTLLLDTGEMRSVDLTAVSGLRLTDPKLQAQFKDYLGALVNSRSKEKRSVYIDSSDAKARQIAASYMIPTPVWKSSYRLIFDKSAQPTLEGWAIVDNTTGEDWTNINLSLVSGRPISFISPLYEPRYVQRQVAELPDDSAARPVIHEGDVEGFIAPSGVAGGRDAARKKAAPMAQMAPPPPAAAPAQMAQFSRLESLSSLGETATTRDLGELFEYQIATPVTVRKSESAMLPFLQQKIGARKLLVYSNQSSEHPTNAAELTNATGKTLDGGPITVFDAGTYGGEALMETLKTGDKRLISYAVDLGTRITTQFDSKADLVREIHFRRGILTARTAAVETKTYTIRNVDQKPKELIIEHPVRPGYRLLDRKPAETTANAYRFEVKLGPGAVEKFPVTEERVYENTVAVASITPDLLTTYIRNKALSDAGRKQLEQIATLKSQIAAADNESRRTDADITALIRDQDRLRQNINSLNQVSGQQQQVQAYAKQLADQESKLAAMRDRTAELQRKRAALEAELGLVIEKADF